MFTTSLAPVSPVFRAGSRELYIALTGVNEDQPCVEPRRFSSTIPTGTGHQPHRELGLYGTRLNRNRNLSARPSNKRDALPAPQPTNELYGLECLGRRPILGVASSRAWRSLDANYRLHPPM